MRPRDEASYSLSGALTATLQAAYHLLATTPRESPSAALRGSQRVSGGEEGWEGGWEGGLDLHIRQLRTCGGMTREKGLWERGLGKSPTQRWGRRLSPQVPGYLSQSPAPLYGALTGSHSHPTDRLPPPCYYPTGKL